MNESSMSDFAYVGERPYIRGVDLLKFFLEQQTANAFHYPSEIQSLRLSKELKCNGIWTDGSDDLIAVAEFEPSATLEYVDATKEKHRALFFETGARITRTLPDAPTPVSSVASVGPFAGRAILVPPIDATAMLDGLVTANKALHASTLKERGLAAESIRFVYVERLQIIVDRHRSPVNLTITHRGARVKGGRTYTLNLAEFGLETGLVRAVICFSFEAGLDGL